MTIIEIRRSDSQPHPYVVSGGLSEVVPSNLTAFRREFWVDAVRVKGLPVNPQNRRSLRIDLTPSLFSDSQPFSFFDLVSRFRHHLFPFSLSRLATDDLYPVMALHVGH
jgi:hypothetical protein